MTVKSVNFAAQVDAWTKQTNDRMTRVFRGSAQEVIGEMQKPVGAGGNMPVDTGFLRASLQVTLDGPVPASRENPGGSFNYNPSPASLVIAGAEIGATITASYGAAYAGHVEYGANGRAPRGFVRSAAAQWQAIVNRVVAQAKTNAR